MRLRSLPFLIVPALIVSGCGGEPVPEFAEKSSDPAPLAEDVRTTIQQANAHFMGALQSGDPVAAAANYAVDAVLMLPNTPAFRGLPAIESGLRTFLADFKVKSGRPRTLDVVQSGDLAVETGTFEWTLQPRDGPVVGDRGKYLTVWRQQGDGSWKIIRDINNSDLKAIR